MRNIEREKEDRINSERSWGSILIDLVGAVADNVGTSITRSIREKQERMTKKIIAAVLILSGAVFFLIGLAAFINEFFDGSSWIGHVAVGLVIMIIGILIPKKET